MRMKQTVAVALVILFLLSPMTALQANAAFVDNEHWIESSASTVNSAYYANQPFVAMFYRTTCPNSGTRKLAVEGWMTEYGLDVYGVDVDRYGIPDWVWQTLPSSSVTLPIICIVNSSSEYACFTAKDGMKQIQKYLHDYLGIYDDREVDFSKLNQQIIDQYNCRASTAKALYSDTVATGVRVTAQAQAIVEGLSDDMDKLKAIYDWITANIYYDYGMLEGKSPRFVTAAQTLDFQQSVCEGFANLTAAMCQAAGIPCRVVTGFAAGVGTDATIGSVWACYEDWLETGDLEAFRSQLEQYTNHAWNEAYVDGRWVVVDTTWGCNNDAVLLDSGMYYRIRGTPTDEYFDLSVEGLSQSHVTWTDYSADLRVKPMSAGRATVSGMLDDGDREQVMQGLLAVYDRNGKMLFCQEADLSAPEISLTIPWDGQAETVKLFLLDEGQNPLGAAYGGHD